MRIRALAVAAVIAAATTLPMAGVAFAQDRNCSDFEFQEDAQAALRSGDPDNLDDDDDGEACETLPRRGSSSGRGASDDDSNDNSDDDSNDNSNDDSNDNSNDDSNDNSNDNSNDEGQVRTKPKGSVDTGDGSSAPDTTAPAVLALAGIAAIGVTAAAARSSRC
jgi:hypothetical protein